MSDIEQKEYLLYLVDMYYKYKGDGARKMAINYGKRIGKILYENQTDLSAKELFPKEKTSLTKSTTDND